MKKYTYDNDIFDVRIDIDIQVRPVKPSESKVETLKWEAINHRMKWEGQILAKSLEEYFKHLVESEVKYEFKDELEEK